jgi:hypothetical protein
LLEAEIANSQQASAKAARTCMETPDYASHGNY